jgi:hypothetical protein
VSSCLTIWPGSTFRVSTLSIRLGQHQPQPVVSDLWDPEIESYLAALAAFDASTLSSHLFVPRDIRSSASRFFRSASGNAMEVLLRRLDLVVTHPVHHRPQIRAPASSQEA